MEIVPGSTQPANIDLTNVAVANVRVSGTILVYAEMNTFDQSALDAIENLGAEIVSANEFVGIVEAWVPFDQVDELASLESVDFVRLPMAGILQTGLVNSAGDAILNVDDVRAQLSVDGTGIRIGVISDGVDHLAMVQGGANPDLPAITINPARPGTIDNGEDEGTAMLEIIHDLAPGAQLFFSSGISGQVAMVDSIFWLLDQGVDVIVDDLGFFDQHYFSDDVVAQAVEAAIDAGVTYLTSAGNQAQMHYQGQWNNAGGVHDFDPTANLDNLLNIGVVPAGGAIDVVLQWSDAEGNSGNNYNFGLWDVVNSGYVATSVDPQTGIQNPIEVIQWTNTTGAPLSVAIAIDDFNSPASREFELFVLPRNFGLANLIDNDRTTGDSVIGHAALLETVSVAAIDANDPGNDTIEIYSNQGTSTIYTNFVAQTSVERNSLDGAGIDGVQTRIGQLGFFNNPFFGTSAAAPHAAAISALMLEINPSLTPADISAVLNTTAADIGAAGYDNISGFGRFNALAAAQAVPIASGDYNDDGTVDAADYTVWRDRLGQTGLVVYSSADGNGDGQITQADYDVWKAHFGQAVTPTPGSGSGGVSPVMAAATEEVEQSASPQIPSDSLEITSVVSANFAVLDLGLLHLTTTQVNTRSGTLAFGVNRGVSLHSSVRQDAGLLAWLSARSADRFDDHSELAEDNRDLSADWMDRNRAAADSVFNDVCGPLVRSRTESLVTVG